MGVRQLADVCTTKGVIMAEETKKTIAGSKQQAADEEKQEAKKKIAVEKAQSEAEEPKEEQKTAKAGKRSATAVRETEEKTAKEDRKTAQSSEPSAKEKKPQQKPPRSKLERKGKKYRKSAELIEKDKEYNLADALELACKTSTANFDATVELHIRLNVDPKQADQNIRDSVVLPAGSGKTVKVAVFADETNAKKAKAKGADIAGEDEVLAMLDKGLTDFDVLIAMPNLMVKLAKYARILGPKGLMPNPKSGTVTADVAKAVEQSKAGKVEYRVDGNGIIHIGVGKVSFGGGKLKQNADELVGSVKQNKPSSVKGAFIRSIYAATTMGPSIAIDPSKL
ncbi:MAG TPA: 50S ribosomal protein L1 [Candidatus Saccharimonadales bacterium]|nr:50S ribosomal protein L1 [Candidatus Saccharimonadales bacterium]